jgi:hypothetical protein
VIEEFLKAHQYTIAAFVAASTFAAVVVSLGLAYSARRADRTKLKATADLWYLLKDPIDPKTAPRLLKVVITNYGRFPAHRFQLLLLEGAVQEGDHAS